MQRLWVWSFGRMIFTGENRNTRSKVSLFFFFSFNRHCNTCGFWPAQLSLSILSRKVFTECCCQRHVKPPTWRTSDLERSNSRHQASLTSETTRANPSSGRWNYGREIAKNFAESGDFHVTFRRSHVVNLRNVKAFRKFTTWDRRLYFPSEGRRAEEFFARKIRRFRPGLNPRTRVPKASTLTSRPLKPLQCHSVHNKSHMDWPGIEHGPPQWEAGIIFALKVLFMHSTPEITFNSKSMMCCQICMNVLDITPIPLAMCLVWSQITHNSRTAYSEQIRAIRSVQSVSLQTLN